MKKEIKIRIGETVKKFITLEEIGEIKLHSLFCGEANT